MATPADSRLSVSAQVAGNLITIAADSQEPDGSFGDGLDTRATVVTPSSTATEIRLPQAAPGRYRREFSVDEPGVYRVLVRQVEPSGDVLEEMTGVVVDDVEQRLVGTNQALLEELATQTGGHKLERPADAFARDASVSGLVWQPIWQWLLAAALILFPVDVAMRRLQVSVPGWPIARWRRRL
jgi:Ca-activated chloride channel family protein